MPGRNDAHLLEREQELLALGTVDEWSVPWWCGGRMAAAVPPPTGLEP